VSPSLLFALLFLALLALQAYPSMVSKHITMNAPHPLAMEDSMSLKQVMASSYIALFQVPIIPEAIMRAGDYGFLKNLFFGKKMGVKRKTEESPLAMTPADLEVYKYNLSRSGALTAALNYYRNIFSNANREFLARIGFARHPAPPYHTFLSPTLVLWGADDGALLLPQAKAIAKYVAGDLCDVVTVKNCEY
jgi:epoxide hydrolase 4